MNRLSQFIIVPAITFLIYACNILNAATHNDTPPKYVFLFIGDGMGTQHIAATEDFKQATQNMPLSFTSFPVRGELTTFCANKPVTDSAAAGTALSCGSKANYYSLCVDTNGNNLTPLTMYAKDAGMRVGIATSVTLNHATPAAFYANAKSRSSYDDIAKQLPSAQFDFFAAGGIVLKELKQANIYTLYRDAGYSVVFGREGLAGLKPGTPAIALHKSGYNDALPRLIDSPKTSQPDHISLPDITQKAIEMLDNPNGFFLMVEGGAIDWASHANAGATMIYEMLDFDNAVAVAIEFYKKHPGQTLIIVTADHETGTLTYKPEADISLLSNQTGSDATLKKIVTQAMKKCVSFESLAKSMEKFFGKKFTAEELVTLEKTYTAVSNKEETSEKKSLYGKIHTIAARAIRIINKRAGLNWGSGGHSASNVPLYAIGHASEKFAGEHDNTYIGLTLIQMLK